MRCHICDRAMNPEEIQTLPDSETEIDCCSTCLEIALDAAYCDGFQRPDEDDLEFELEYGDGAIELLESDAFVSETGPSLNSFLNLFRKDNDNDF